MIYRGGWNNHNLFYAESTDALTWTKYSSTPVIANHTHSWFFKDGSTYYVFADSTISGNMDLYTSSDGVNWTLDTANVISLGTSGTWDDTTLGNSTVWIEGGAWKMLYDASGNGQTWQVGLATSADGRAWTKSGSNPVIAVGAEDAMKGTGWIWKRGTNDYWLWNHAGQHDVQGGLPTDGYRYKSSNLTTWAFDPSFAGVRKPTFRRKTADEGPNPSTVGQVADVHLVEALAKVYYFYTGDSDGSSLTGNSTIKLATYNGSLEQLIHTTEDAECEPPLP